MKKITVVIDMQNDFLTGSLPNPDAVSIIPSILNEIKKSDFVIYTRDTHGSDYFETQEGKKLPIKHCIKDTWGWEIVDELNPNSIPELNKTTSWCVVNKPTFGYVDIWKNNVFSTLMDTIGQNNIEVTFCGTCTDICVVSNALIVKSLYPELTVNVKADACAGLTPEKHKAALDVMSSCQINIIKKTKL